PAVARGEPVLVLRALVEVLHRPAGVAVAVQRDDPLDLIGGDPMRADLADPAIEKPVRPLGLVARPLAMECPLRAAEPFGRLEPTQPPRLEPRQHVLEPHLPYLLQQRRPTHPRPRCARDESGPDRSRATKLGQMTC